MAPKRDHDRDHQRLEEGVFDPHGTGKPICRDCEKVEVTTHVGDERDMRVRDIVWRCPNHDLVMTSFILGLEHLRHRGSSKVFPVCRYCTRHQNHHIHYYDNLRPDKQVARRDGYGPVHDAEAMMRAQEDSSGHMYYGYEGLVKQWLSRWKKHG